MTPEALVDAEARRRIETSLDETLLVEAGAGTGKTDSLVKRIAAVVVEGRTTLERVAAITFTEAAAAELRDRVRQELERRAAEELQPEARRRCEQGAADVDQAAIQTLHGFAAMLLMERPLDAGLPPSFEILDEIQSELRFEDAWRAWLDDALEAPDLQPAMRLALSVGLSLKDMREAARLFHDRYDLLYQCSFPLEPLPDPQAAGRLMEASSELERLLAYGPDGGDRLTAHLEEIAGFIGRLADTQSDDQVRIWRLLARRPRLTAPGGKQSDWNIDPDTGQNACKLVKDMLRDLQGVVNDEVDQVRRAALAPLLEAIRKFVLTSAEERRRQGSAEFHDLLVWARDMLRSNIAVRDYFRERFTHIFIDEFQDTDPIQAEIAMLLAEESRPEEPADERVRDWRGIRPEPGKLFVVGDPKQSIYRFRFADISLLEKLKEVVGKGSLSLVQNFRSNRPIIDWVNHLFGEWMVKDVGQPEYTPLAPRGPGVLEKAGGVHYFGGSQDRKAFQVRSQEAAAIASLLQQVQGGEWTVTEPNAAEGDVTLRPAELKDVCLLVPSRTGLRDIEMALEDAGVPYRLDSASLVFQTQEVRDLLNCLEAIDNPIDEVAVAAALRSPALACSDVDMASYVQGGGRLNYLSRNHKGSGPVPDSLQVLEAFHCRRTWTSPPLLVEEFIREQRLMEVALDAPRPRERWRRYQFLVERARAFAESGGTSLRAFIAWMRRQQSEGARAVEAPVPEGDEDAVRIMTVHGSKGLEFPIVVLADLGNSGNRRTPAVLFDPDAPAVEARLGSDYARFQTNGFEALRTIERECAAQEDIRLFYVAATRARDHLVVSLFRSTNASGTQAEVVEELLHGHEELWRPLTLSETNVQVAAPEAVDLIDETPLGREGWLARRRSVIAAASRPAAVAATALAHERREEAGGADEPWRRGRAGTAIGRAVHAVLQTVDLATGEGLKDAAVAQAQAEGVPKRTEEILALCRRALASDAVSRAVRAGRWWREVPVGAPVNGGVLEGFVDLLFEDAGGGLVVVDYKTDALQTRADVDAAMGRYRLQGGAYALALTKATGKSVTEVVFLFLEPAEEICLYDVPALTEEVSVATSRSFVAEN